MTGPGPSDTRTLGLRDELVAHLRELLLEDQNLEPNDWTLRLAPRSCPDCREIRDWLCSP